MSLLVAVGSPTTVISDQRLAELVHAALAQVGPRKKVIAVPPDITRLNSRAGIVTGAVAAHYGDVLTDVLPALGTHVPMTDAQIARMYPDVPRQLFRAHDWRRDVVTVGELPAAFVRETTQGLWERPWPAQLNRLLWHGGHDLIISIGQVVPHEVAGMANGVKNLLVGTGGVEGINESHFIGAAWGMERMMGRTDTPVRALWNEAERRFLGGLDIVYVQTVVGPSADGLVTRGVFIGRGTEPFTSAAALSLEVNFTLLDEAPRTVIAWLDPEEFHTTWLGNKAIYRTRMAIADGGEVIVLAPGLRGFGEDPAIDALIRRFGYRTTPEVLGFVRDHADLRDNLSAAAHLIHGSTEGRFTVTYCPGPHLSRAEIEGVGYQWGDLAAMTARYTPQTRPDGWQADLPATYVVGNPALGLWANRTRFER